MKYFETKYPYYALIPAENKEKAVEIYINEICEDDDNCLEEEMKEVTKEVALTRFLEEVPRDLRSVINRIDEFNEAHILLIDNQLI